VSGPSRSAVVPAGPLPGEAEVLAGAVALAGGVVACAGGALGAAVAVGVSGLTGAGARGARPRPVPAADADHRDQCSLMTV
jgi:hypothetical protein